MWQSLVNTRHQRRLWSGLAERTPNREGTKNSPRGYIKMLPILRLFGLRCHHCRGFVWAAQRI